MTSICVFCGSRDGIDADFQQITRQLSTLFVEHNITLIYGAGAIGLMGILADEVIRAGGRATGIIPQHLCKQEIIHRNLTEVFVTETMLERKQLMMEKADGFIALPGGLGTLDEILEVATWKQLGQLDKPLCLVNTNGFYDQFIDLIDHLIKSEFLDQRHSALFTIVDTPQQAISTTIDALKS